MFNRCLLCYLLLICSTTLANPIQPTTPRLVSNLQKRQDDVETRTLTPTASSLELQSGGPSQTASPTTSYRLETAAAPLQLPDTIGLIMPNPWSKLYVGEYLEQAYNMKRLARAKILIQAGLEYSLGFVDLVPRPAPTTGGWLRQIQPLLMLPSYRVGPSLIA